MNNQAMEYGEKVLILAMKVVKPNLTDEQARNVIVNVGNYIQLKRLEQANPELLKTEEEALSVDKSPC